MTNKYSFIIGLEKSIFRAAVVGIPILLEVTPSEWLDISIGAALMFLLNYAKNRDIKEV